MCQVFLRCLVSGVCQRISGVFDAYLRCVSGVSRTYVADRPPQEGVEVASSCINASFCSAELQPGLEAVDHSFNQHDLVQNKWTLLKV